MYRPNSPLAAHLLRARVQVRTHPPGDRGIVIAATATPQASPIPHKTVGFPGERPLLSALDGSVGGGGGDYTVDHVSGEDMPRQPEVLTRQVG